MKISNLRKILALTAIGSIFGTAHAFDYGADWSYLYYPQNVTMMSNIPGWLGAHEITTAQFLATRRAGADGGTTTLLPAAPSSIHTYCVEIGQYLPQGYLKHEHVSPLLGSTTTTGGVTGPITFDAARTEHLERLWGSFFPLATNNVASAAFQLAQWELAFDNDVTLQNNTGKVWATGPFSGGNSYDLAEQWLTAIRDGRANQRQSLLLLSDPNIQDQITPVPEPATVAALGIGTLVAFLRKRR